MLLDAFTRQEEGLTFSLSSLPGCVRAIQPPAAWMPRTSPGH